MFLNEDLIGRQEDIELFNNIGCLDAFEGRLTVWLTINQTPRVRWEFEVARGDYTFDALFVDTPPKKLTSWDGSNPQLVVENPTVTFRGGPRRQSIGYAEQVLYGDVTASCHYFEFYLPNTDFMRQATGGQLEAITKALNNESFQVEIGNDWSVEIFTNQDVLNWLNPKNQNRGSMITLKMRLFQTKQASTTVQNLSVKSILEAKQLISDLCLMLSYVNGGYVNPVYVIAKKIVELNTNQIPIEDVAAIAIAEYPLIAPQEEIGQGFIKFFGINDLLDFIKCFPSFQRMLQTPWREKWIVILEWYFQAILRPGGRRRNVLLPVAANALGTLLENLARLILVDEEPEPTKRKDYKGLYTKERIKALLERIGISDEDKEVENFIDIRNNSTHAKTKSIQLTEREQLEVVLRAVQWVDEVILWRLGYAGQYIERNLTLNQGTQPRYDLSLRNSNW